MKTSSVLFKAADITRMEGWTRGGEGWGTTGAVCLEGAIRSAYGEALPITARPKGQDVSIAVNNSDAGLAVRTVLSLPDSLQFRLYSWNDKPVRTEEQVLWALEEAARMAQNAEGLRRLGLRPKHKPTEMPEDGPDLSVPMDLPNEIIVHLDGDAIGVWNKDSGITYFDSKPDSISDEAIAVLINEWAASLTVTPIDTKVLVTA